MPATTEDLEQLLAFAVRFDGRKRSHTGDELMARITAKRLVKLDRAGFVMMRRPASGDLSHLQGGAKAKVYGAPPAYDGTGWAEPCIQQQVGLCPICRE